MEGALLRLGPVNIQSTLISIGETVVRRHPIKLSLNFLGLAFLFLLPGFTPSEAQNRDFVRLQPSMQDLEAESAARATRDTSYYAYRSSVGWFWSCDATCAHRKVKYEADEAAWARAHAAVERQLIEANSALGVFSAPAVEQARDTFWAAFGRGMQMVRSFLCGSCLAAPPAQPPQLTELFFPPSSLSSSRQSA